MVGTATLTIAPSSRIMKKPTPSTPRANQGFRAAGRAASVGFSGLLPGLWFAGAWRLGGPRLPTLVRNLAALSTPVDRASRCQTHSVGGSPDSATIRRPGCVGRDPAHGPA